MTLITLEHVDIRGKHLGGAGAGYLGHAPIRLRCDRRQPPAAPQEAAHHR